jgi:putative transposase
VFKAIWQRCRVHFMRNAFAHVPNDQQSMVAGAIRTVFAQETPQGREHRLEPRR